jgi:Mn2+/Fe2+ NRAMP family transporter
MGALANSGATNAVAAAIVAVVVVLNLFLLYETFA